MAHFIVGTSAGVIVDNSGLNGCVTAITLGVAKEVIDPVFSIPDVIATSLYCILPRR